MNALHTLRPVLAPSRALARHGLFRGLPASLPPTHRLARHQSTAPLWRRHSGPDSIAEPGSHTHLLRSVDKLWFDLPEDVGKYVKPGDQRHRENVPFLWLRDNCRCSTCVNQDTMQRNFDTFALPRDLRVARYSADATQVHLEWSDGHRSTYDWEFLITYTFFHERPKRKVGRVLWDHSIKANPPTVEHADVMSSDAGVADMTMKIVKHGLVFVNNVPYDTPEATKALLERIAFIRETHYGGFYDFKPDLALADTAYTNLALPAHTDTTYFTEPAGLQSFHLLSHEAAPGEGAGPQGGQSLLVDGFEAARRLREHDQGFYDTLASVNIPWHASGNEGITIGPYKKFPVLEQGAGGRVLHRVRWNNDDRGVVPVGLSNQWYEAARKWDELIKSPDLQYWFQMVPGQVLIFDNWRVLHGRSAFTGIRRICGGYINRDDFISRWMNTNFGREESLRRVME